MAKEADTRPTPHFPTLSPPPAPRGSARVGQFGSPERRVTDILLVANCVAFLGQWLSGQRLTVWGAKVGEKRLVVVHIERLLC